MADNEPGEEQFETKVKFNQAVSHLNRINEAFILGNKSSILPDYPFWYKALEVLHREIWHKMTEDQVKDITALRKKCSELLQKHIRTNTSSHHGPRRINTTEIYNSLDAYDKCLRVIYGDHGYINPDETDPTKLQFG